ncbi:FMN reductase [Leucobacter luti]|uniref:CE1759 family FMN reductase n=1 Tax=Leucobacter luti TaxID=340320 RepID=UPI0010488120|nr:CE1759 family FMN reductase [Leucobacter luti]MCW2289787.1 FMN reductase [Leucobacter luti]TCK34323.1 FMN reductase [Leucobacter luti]
MNTPFDGAATLTDPELTAAHRTVSLALVSAGTSDPSTTTMLARRVAEQAARLGEKQGLRVEARLIDLRVLAADVTTALVTQHVSPALQEASDIMRDAGGIIASTPVYKAGASGLFTSFFQVLDNDLLIGTPVVLAATAGSARHALVVDDQIRGMFAYLRTISVPTALFAEPDDWTRSDFSGRIERAATELIALISGDFRTAVRGESWAAYQHSFGSAGGTELGIDLSSDLMRLATGGAA